MSFLSKEYFQFFEDLEKNNNKEWFDKNRERYEQFVKTPFRNLVAHIMSKLEKSYPEHTKEVNKSIFRINKDIRFSKDKSPYKLNMAAVFSRMGTKDENPGFYIHLGHQELFIGGGMYMLTKEQLAKVRQEIFYNEKEFKKIISAKKFKDYYSKIEGEKNKVLPEEYREFMKTEPYIANKQFYYMAKLKKSEVTAADFDKTILTYFEAGKDFNQFLWRAISD